ncbi:glycosyltransferase 87 family protein [Streptacidiphilus albus]|uniref:glycosyltransferase 87 family protein n=1 Tax=Streptacidiphilus albus TaxID=105425 RepID=UPI000B222199|nr:glycosyltransferase 87 family protein [Streptacidiphilus albus]
MPSTERLPDPASTPPAPPSPAAPPGPSAGAADGIVRLLLRSRTAALVLWLGTRAVLFAAAVAEGRGSTDEVHTLYPHWAAELAHGHFPFHEATWQYPPVAGLVFLAPRALPFLPYAAAFAVLMLLCDAAVAAMLLGASRGPERRLDGLWLWVLGLPLLLQLPYIRFDVAVTALAVGSVLLLGRSAVGGGVLAALGALVKAWPVLVLIGTPRGRVTHRSWSSALVTGVLLAGLAAALFTHAFGFLGEQGSRGIEIESLPGSLLLAAKLVGYHGTVRYSYGSFQVFGPGVSALSTATLALTVLGLGWLLLWRLRARVWTAATAADAAFTAMLVFVTTSRVISPQYFVWLLGLGALCLAFRATGQRRPALALLALTALTTLGYPLLWSGLKEDHLIPVAVLLLRNLGLLAATVHSAVRLQRSTAARTEALS